MFIFHGAGHTRVLVSVLGPRPSRSARLEDSERCLLELQVTPLSGQQGPKEAELCTLLRQTLASCVVLTAHPRKVITVAVHVLADDGGAAACAVNAAVLAFADAGVPMRTLAGAVTLGLLLHQRKGSSGGGSSGGDPGEALLDLCSRDESSVQAQALVVFGEDCEGAEEGGAPCPLAALAAGPIPLDALQGALEVACHAARQVIKFQRGALREKVARDASTNFQSVLGIQASELTASPR